MSWWLGSQGGNLAGTGLSPGRGTAKIFVLVEYRQSIAQYFMRAVQIIVMAFKNQVDW